MNKFTLKLNQNSIEESKKYIDTLLEDGKNHRFKRNILMGHMDVEGNFSFCTRPKGSTLNEYIKYRTC